jgi:DNA-binding NtrC family response regulator
VPLLTVQAPWGPPVSHLVERPVVLGRSASCDVIVPDAAVSRRHLALSPSGDEWTVEDLGSKHGTTVNGEALEGRRVLRSGDVVAVGNGGTTLVYGRRVPGSLDAGTVTSDMQPVRPSGAGSLVGASAAMERVRAELAIVAASDATVLVRGENGTGKELVAHALHDASQRRAGPFVVVDCPSIPHDLFESELFGVERGVATGVDARHGRLESAEGGTLLLDEIGDLSAAGQAKLLRFLQDRTVSRVGSRTSRPLDVRVVAATNRDLESDIDAGRFRRDLLYRLAVVTIELPPLRERLEDLPLLCEHVLSRAPGPRVRLSQEALDVLRAHAWPGNVRELHAAIERARLFAMGRGVIQPDDLPPDVRGRAANPAPHSVATPAANASATPRPAAPEATDALADRLSRGEASFWADVWEPYTRHELPRDAVRDLVARGLATSGGRVKTLARHWGMLDEREYRRFVDFLRNNGLRPGSDILRP